MGFLRASGTKVFLAVDSIRAGTEWEKEVLTSLVAARRVFVFWSVNAAASEWVQWEYTQADDRGIPVIPVALDATPMPAALSKFQGLPELATLLQSVQLAPGTDEVLFRSMLAQERRLRPVGPLGPDAAAMGSMGKGIGPVLDDLPPDVVVRVMTLVLRKPVPASYRTLAYR